MTLPGSVSSYRRWLIALGHALLLSMAYQFAFLLRFDFAMGPRYSAMLLETLPLVLLVKLAVLTGAGLFRGWWRYAGIHDLVDIIKAAALSSAVCFAGVELLFRNQGFPRSVLLIDLLLTICVLGGVRFSVRVYQETAGRYVPRKNTIIVGAGEAGGNLARELKTNTQLDLNPVGYVDDDPTKQGIKIQGIRVLGKIVDLSNLVGPYKAECLMIAIPSAGPAQMREIVEQCGHCGIEMKILPAMGTWLNGSPIISKVRRVKVEDLLGRVPVALDLASIQKRLTGKVLMITGAGGSIGSELARQLANFHPRKLVLFERGENDLHKIDVELHNTHPEMEYATVVGDILDVRRLREVIGEHRPHSIFHAAAYKHVPMMEKNCFQAVVNNVFGTYNVALVAKQYGVADFLMISSDKAVNPTNVMGVTKRVAELVILGLQRQQTRFVAVRFGNVLGSNGSVLPLFEQQLARGGPLTVTHPEAQRYFMTIPEAVALVLQASTMGHGGEIFVLDMGAQIKIVDLANNLIRLSGLRPGQDVQVVFTGLRPGEKLYEELQLGGEGIKPTSHAKIRVLEGGSVEFSRVSRWLEELSALVEAKNLAGLVRKLREIVPEYQPSEPLLAACEVDQHDFLLRYEIARLEMFHNPDLQPQALAEVKAA
jgi:FlaA1/EpsC-like NDP-sugar epimerase